MTIQTDATTRQQNQQQPISAQQIADENSAANAASGFLPPIPPGASDNISEGQTAQTTEAGKSVADIVREQQRSQAQDQEDFLASIAARRRQHMAEGTENDDDNDDFNEELDNSDDSQENHVQEQEAGAAQDAQQQQDAAQQVADNQPRFFTHTDGKQYCELLVNGEKKVVPAERVIAAAQKLEAGDERLRQAAQERAQLEADRIRFQQEQAARQIQQPSVDPDAEANLKAQLRAGFDRLVNEGDDSAMDALVETIMKGRNAPSPQVDIHQLASQVSVEQNQRAWDAQLPLDDVQFTNDPAFADINGNEVLSQRAKEFAIEMTRELDARSRNVSPLWIMQQAGIKARNEALAMAQALGLQAPVQQSQTQQVARADAVAARKQQLGNTATGGAAPAAQVAGEPRKAAPDGGRNPGSLDAKAAAFASMNAVRTQPMIKR